MFGKNDDTEKSRGQNRRNTGTSDTRIYSLESIMGLQKVLENGIKEEERVTRKHPLQGQCQRPNGQIVPVNLAQRIRNSLAAMVGRLRYSIQLVFTRKRQFRRTSAR
jgi:hypothetical protein